MKFFLSLFILLGLLSRSVLATQQQGKNADRDSSVFIRLIKKYHVGVSSEPHPAASFEEAIALFAHLQQKEATLPLSPKCHSRLFSHGQKTERVFVLLHGLTSCPEQFVPLAKIIFDSGANVIVPRAKDAGFSNLLNNQQGDQSGQDLINQAAEGLDIAAGLGDHITLVGLSAGAVGAAWMAEHRDGIDQVVLISPFFGAYGYPVWESDFLAFFFAHLPNYYFWKNKTLKAAVPGPNYVYPQYGTKSIGSTLELGKNIRSFHGMIKTKRLDILLSAFDHTVNGELTKQQEKIWATKNPGKVFEYEFPKEMKVPHDCMTPNQPASKVAIVYPKILEILKVEENSSSLKNVFLKN